VTARWSAALALLTLAVVRPAGLWADARAGFSLADVVVSQDACAGAEAVFTVTLRPPRGTATTVEYQTADQTAVAGADYTASSGTLVFPPQTTVQTVTVPVVDVLVPAGPDKTFVLRLGHPTHANLARGEAVATIRAPAVARCETCNLSCDDGDTCTHDFCSPTEGCRHVDIGACSLDSAEADCKLPSPCRADRDGDGLSDAWETAGGIDFDCNGELTADEMVFRDVDPVLPDGTANPHPSADPDIKDVFVLYDWMELPDQLTAGQPTACAIHALPRPTNFFYPFHSDDCGFDQKCVAGVRRGHSDEPDPTGLQTVIDAFAAHGVRLHLVRGRALAHANVTSYGPPVAECVADLSGTAFSGERAVDFYDLKTANLHAIFGGHDFDEARLLPAFHYAVFAHRHTCDSSHDCNKVACLNPDTNANPLFNETGLAEQPGNDLVVTLGGFRDRNLRPSVLAEGGTFMHELGHNLVEPRWSAVRPRRADGSWSGPAQLQAELPERHELQPPDARHRHGRSGVRAG
jgi:hypothetical protein